MSIFKPLAPGRWQPSPLAGGPFAGLQGGAVAALLTAELEARAAAEGWGSAVSACASFLQPTPFAELHTKMVPVITGGRVSVIDNTLFVADAEEPCASVRVTFARERAIALPPLPPDREPPHDPTGHPMRATAARHDRPWFMEAMEARVAGDTAWFRMKHRIIDGAGPLATVLGPADWTHGLARPLQDVAADPNVNLAVHLLRPPRSDWIGIRAHTRWQPERGLGMGRGVLLDASGEIGCVAMAVVLLPMPKTPA